MMNKRGNIMFGLMIFVMALAMMVMFISPMSTFIDFAQQSNNLNCKGFIYNGDVNNSLSFNATLDGGASGSPIGCLAIRLYLPYIILVFLIGGLILVLGGKANEIIGIFPAGSDLG